MIAAYNSLGCAYGVSSRPNEALDAFLEAYRNFSPQTKTSLKWIYCRVLPRYTAMR